MLVSEHPANTNSLTRRGICQKAAGYENMLGGDLSIYIPQS
jgi:hypothetical protein